MKTKLITPQKVEAKEVALVLAHLFAIIGIISTIKYLLS
jgi:hypothetical protein